MGGSSRFFSPVPLRAPLATAREAREMEGGISRDSAFIADAYCA
jgi:hypothetical protein